MNGTCLYNGHSSEAHGISPDGWDPGVGRRIVLEATSSQMRVAPSPGVQDSNGIPRRQGRPRMHKREYEHRLRGSRLLPSERRPMRFVGIDIAAENHVVAVLDEHGTVLTKPTTFREEATGYTQLRALLGLAAETLVVMEAT